MFPYTIFPHSDIKLIQRYQLLQCYKFWNLRPGKAHISLHLAKKLWSLVGNYKRFGAIYCLSLRSGTLKKGPAYFKTAVTIHTTNPANHNMNTNFAVRSEVLRAVTMKNKTLFGLTEICRRFGLVTAPVFVISFYLVERWSFIFTSLHGVTFRKTTLYILP